MLKPNKYSNKNLKEKSKIAVSVENVSKTFIVPHEKNSTLKQAALNVFAKKSYEKFNALKDISFEVKKGEFLGIIGKNGSGKSTLLKILAGIYVPDKGRIKIKGKLSPFLELGVGFNPELTARENVFLGGAILGISRKELEKKLDSIIRFAELEKFIDTKFKNFSSGMQVRLAFSLSIHAHAEILLMDEVLAVGDSNFQNKCLEVFASYRDSGKTVILVTHDISTVQRYCDKVLLIDGGSIVRMGNAEDVGNEYIRRNIKEADAQVAQSISKSSKKQKKKKIEIVKVSLLNKNDREKKIFVTGDSMSIKVNFKKQSDVSLVNIGVGLYRDDGTYILSVNTMMDKFNIQKDSVILNFPSMPLLQGNYYINIVSFGRIEQKYYDFKEKEKKFRVFPHELSGKYRGVVNINHSWE